jgi:hypothetical protein
MTARPAEVTRVHSRLLKCALEVEDCRAYWKHVDLDETSPRAERAFEEYWFGARSLARIEVLIINFRARFDAYPPALAVLGRWPDMDPVTRKVLSHWHLQLADPLYRRFTGDYLVKRRQAARPEVTRDRVTAWVTKHTPEQWRTNTRIHFASKLLSAAYSAGLVASNRDPRPLVFPRVEDAALTYLLYLLRGVDFEGTLTRNPYLASVGLAEGILEDRLRGLAALEFRRQGDLVDFTWGHPDVGTWARLTVASRSPGRAEGAP